jgi:very-short-patch-repair endonuclease
LAHLAREHQGLVTRRLAVSRHVSPGVLEAALRSGALHRIRPGVFVDGSVWAATGAHARYELEVRGVLLDHPDRLASHHAALALAGLPLFEVDTGMVDVVAAVGTSKRRRGLHLHVATQGQRIRIEDPAVNAVSVEDACVLTAAASGLEAGVVAMDAALHRRMTTSVRLTTSLSSCGVRYGASIASAAISAVDPACESPGETRTRLVLQSAGLDVRSQVALHDADGFIGRVDFLVGERVVVEFDGAVKYAGLDGRRALMEEKRREDRLRAAGFRVVRVAWADLRDPARLIARVRGQLAA